MEDTKQVAFYFFLSLPTSKILSFYTFREREREKKNKKEKRLKAPPQILPSSSAILFRLGTWRRRKAKENRSKEKTYYKAHNLIKKNINIYRIFHTKALDFSAGGRTRKKREHKEITWGTTTANWISIEYTVLPLFGIGLDNIHIIVISTVIGCAVIGKLYIVTLTEDFTHVCMQKNPTLRISSSSLCSSNKAAKPVSFLSCISTSE